MPYPLKQLRCPSCGATSNSNKWENLIHYDWCWRKNKYHIKFPIPTYGKWKIISEITIIK